MTTDRRKGRKGHEAARDPAAPREPRTPLSQVGGPVRAQGDPELSEVARRAWEGPHARGPDDLTHGFHAYPARMHPGVAAILLDGLSERRGLVLDPFCGGGTVLVEGMVADRRCFGIDLNPLAIRIAEVRCDWRQEPSRRRFAEHLERVTERSLARVRGRVPVHAPLSREEAGWYDPHVLKELGGLREEILEVDDERDRRALGMVFSAIVVKFSRQRAETAEEVAPKRIRKGLVSEFFQRKGTELVERWAALDAAVPKPVPRPRLRVGDARRAGEIVQSDVRMDLILASPPYGGTYDYAHHHARRLAWLEMEPRGLSRDEIGSRRALQDRGAERRWDTQVRAVLRSMEGMLADGGRIALVMGDGQIGRRRIPADEQVGKLAPGAGLRLRAAASQPRPDRTGGPPRQEHILILTRS